MQDFVEAFVKEKQAALAAKTAAAADAQQAESQREREARLVRLGMCRREYTDATVYSEDYPYQDYKTGRFYRVVPFEVSREEYALICRYDDTPVVLTPTDPIDRLLGRSADKYRRYALLSLITGVMLSLFLAVLFYLMEGLLIAVPIALGGVVLSFLFATLFHAVGQTGAKVNYLVARFEQAALDEKEEG